MYVARLLPRKESADFITSTMPSTVGRSLGSEMVRVHTANGIGYVCLRKPPLLCLRPPLQGPVLTVLGEGLWRAYTKGALRTCILRTERTAGGCNINSLF